MKLTVLGNNGPYPKAGGACSGYLVESSNTKILLDCGNGILARLQKICNIYDIDAIILSHLHSDHISDIMVLKYAIGINKVRKNLDLSIPLYTATDDQNIINKLNYNEAFKIEPIEDESKIRIKNLDIEFKRMKHPVEAYGIKINDGNKSFVYSGDTSYHDELIEFVKDADFFLCEAGILEKDKTEDSPHLSPKEAGDVAEKANVKRLVLTHFWPEYRLDKIMNEAKETYDGILELSEEMKTYYI
ncbi:MBL fold metallo-hydrolase [Caldisalinibacter kiritimatiensis]|uniref:Beta-lactamase-like protein n=1 Tax=Caldisalinibacter kiritimatiensis TaxID=1304284 RepID=R1CPV7_9FIRM|nr:MBL fold metallo-hydrolase [Caldisalinibacter kiritimatiensis]EOD00711.1 beta-lactamase-like protein [Caldisalinibacter kiritimatiensis]